MLAAVNFIAGGDPLSGIQITLMISSPPRDYSILESKQRRRHHQPPLPEESSPDGGGSSSAADSLLLRRLRRLLSSPGGGGGGGGGGGSGDEGPSPWENRRGRSVGGGRSRWKQSIKSPKKYRLCDTLYFASVQGGAGKERPLGWGWAPVRRAAGEQEGVSHSSDSLIFPRML